MEDFLIGLIDACADLGTVSADSLTFGAGRPWAMSIIDGVWNYVALIGIGLTLMYFLLELNQKLALEGRDLNMKSCFAPFLKLVMAIGVLSQGGRIVGALLSLNDAFINFVAEESLITSSPEAVEAIHTYIEDAGLLAQLGMVIPLLVCWILSMVIGLVWWYKAIIYKLEVLFRIGITPIGLADVYSGYNSNAIKYLKGFLVLGIYAASMILLPRIGIQMATEDFAEAFEFSDGGSLWAVIKSFVQLTFIIPFAALSCAGLARTAAKEALGA